MVTTRPSATQRRLLGLLYKDQLEGNRTTVKTLANSWNLDTAYARTLCQAVEEEGLVTSNYRGYRLTELGRSMIKVVFTGGVFDIIHPGHIHTLTSSRRLGDVLVVSVARNSTVVKNKGHLPTHEESQRQELVRSVRCVDVAVLGSETSIFEIVKMTKPDVIALGYDQSHKEQYVVEQSRKRGIKVKVVRLKSPIPKTKSSKLVKDGAIHVF
ncbi:MAG: cytidyltransferase [Thaumarchaeota archaeon]|nr:cytidyltransferase [Nitrososphaerota archaeon]|tara:strand:- start:6607 stop:7242 length:636 start_codon:yes stop_codon:yes gene_type:complete